MCVCEREKECVLKRGKREGKKQKERKRKRETECGVCEIERVSEGVKFESEKESV